VTGFFLKKDSGPNGYVLVGCGKRFWPSLPLIPSHLAPGAPFLSFSDFINITKMTCVAKFVFACTLCYIIGMKDKKIKMTKIKFTGVAIGSFIMAYMTMMGYGSYMFNDSLGEMFVFLIFGVVGCAGTFLAFSTK